MPSTMLNHYHVCVSFLHRLIRKHITRLFLFCRVSPCLSLELLLALARQPRLPPLRRPLSSVQPRPPPPNPLLLHTAPTLHRPCSCRPSFSRHLLAISPLFWFAIPLTSMSCTVHDSQLSHYLFSTFLFLIWMWHRFLPHCDRLIPCNSLSRV